MTACTSKRLYPLQAECLRLLLLCAGSLLPQQKVLLLLCSLAVLTSCRGTESFLCMLQGCMAA